MRTVQERLGACTWKSGGVESGCKRGAGRLGSSEEEGSHQKHLLPVRSFDRRGLHLSAEHHGGLPANS